MSKQYHYVVMYDADSKEWCVDWDSTADLAERRGTTYDLDTDQWSDDSGEDGFETEGTELASFLNEYNEEGQEED